MNSTYMYIYVNKFGRCSLPNLGLTRIVQHTHTCESGQPHTVKLCAMLHIHIHSRMNAEFNLNLNNLFYCRRMSGNFDVCDAVRSVYIWWIRACVRIYWWIFGCLWVFILRVRSVAMFGFPAACPTPPPRRAPVCIHFNKWDDGDGRICAAHAYTKGVHYRFSMWA